MLQSKVLFWKLEWILTQHERDSEKHLQNWSEILYWEGFSCNVWRNVPVMFQSQRLHCVKRPEAHFTKKGNGRKNCEEKVGKSKVTVWEKKTLILQLLVASFLLGWAFQGSFSNNYKMFSFPSTHYISTLDAAPSNYKQCQHLTKVSLTAASVRGPGFHRHRGEHKT